MDVLSNIVFTSASNVALVPAGSLAFETVPMYVPELKGIEPAKEVPVTKMSKSVRIDMFFIVSPCVWLLNDLIVNLILFNTCSLHAKMPVLFVRSVVC